MTLEGRLYAPQGAARVGWSLAGEPTRWAEESAEEPWEVTIGISGKRSDGATLRLELPDARAPSQDGISGDQRLLGLGLTRVRVARRRG